MNSVNTYKDIVRPFGGKLMVCLIYDQNAMKKDLMKRTNDFGTSLLKICKRMHPTIEGKTVRKQLSRSGTSIPFNYSEALSPESRRDFIHKMSIVLKELREVHSKLTIIKGAELITLPDEPLEKALNEANQLIAIFVTSIQTAKRNAKKHP